MTPEEIAAIRERAEAASKGPWKFPNRNWPGVVTSKFGCLWTSGKHDGRINHEPDAEFIAHAPTDIAALLAEAERLNARLDKVRALHQPEARWSAANQPEWSSEYESEALEAADGGDVRRFEVCTHCANVDDMRAYSPELDYKDSIYPCPTIQTLDGSDQ